MELQRSCACTDRQWSLIGTVSKSHSMRKTQLIIPDKRICFFLWMYLATIITETNNRAVLCVLILHKNSIYLPR